MRRPSGTFMALALATVLLPGCRDNEIRTYETPKEARSQRPSMPPPEAPTAMESVAWTLPPGWRQLPGQGMRFATILLESGNPPVEMRVTPLALAAGDVLANVNRWREQIGLDHLEPPELARVVQQSEIDGRTVHLVNMQGPAAQTAQQVLAAILPGDQQAWFFLVMDTPERIGPHVEAFAAFMASVRVVAAAPAAAALPPGHPPVETAGDPGSASSASGLQWTTPPGWQQRQETNPSRLATLTVAAGEAEAEVTITRFPGSVGGLLANLNRWRGQIGLEPVTDLAAQPVLDLDVDGQAAQLLDLTGAATAAGAPPRLLVVLVPRADFTYFVKMTGPAPLVGAERENFVGFARSLRFERQRS